jgi:hypothetical protein
VTLATSVNPQQIVVDAASVYWIEDSSSNSQQPGAIMKMPIGGGSPEVLVAPSIDQAIPTGRLGPILALDTTNVYWVAGGGSIYGSVMMVPLGGGTPVTLSGGLLPTAIAVDGSHVYWTTANSLMSVPIDGGPPITLASWNPSPTGNMMGAIALDGTSVYWTEGTVAGPNVATPDAALLRAPATGGSSTTLGTSGFTEIAVHDGYVYGSLFTQGFHSPAVVRVAVGGGAPTPLVLEQQQLFNYGPIAVDGANLYWIANDGSLTLGAVMSTPLGGGPMTTLATGPAPNSLAVTPTHLFWGHAFNSGDGAPGVLMSAPLL